MSLSIFLAGFVAGAAITAGNAHRRARKDAEMLLYLNEHGPCYGRAIRDGLGMSPWWGSPYPRLYRLEEMGLVSSVEEPGGPERMGLPRRLYSLTTRGYAALLVEASRQPAKDKE